MNVIFIEPAFPLNQREFMRGLAAAGATVIGIGERPLDHLDPELQGWMLHYQQVGNVTDVGAVTDVVRWVQERLWVDRLEAVDPEAFLNPAHHVCDRADIRDVADLLVMEHPALQFGVEVVKRPLPDADHGGAGRGEPAHELALVEGKCRLDEDNVHCGSILPARSSRRCPRACMVPSCPPPCSSRRSCSTPRCASSTRPPPCPG